MECFLCMLDNIAKDWSCCSLRLDRDMLRVWFSCSSFVPSEHGAKLTASPGLCTKDKQDDGKYFFVTGGLKGTEMHRQLAGNC
jgi:hypothetical protein